MKPAHEVEFTQFVNASSARLTHLAWLLCGDEHRAHDLVQEALERVCMRWSRLRTEQPHAYARRIVVNLHTDEWRRRRRELVTLDGSLPERCEAASPSDDRLLLTRLLQSLPQRERQVVVLRHYVDLSEREVADLLGVSIGTVKSSASRGLATLRAELALQQKEMTR
ncbi:SigE family RNA polymerase sigma factor [Yimella sp. cx-573]|nr:SigE family RNA polymerase sigma factor [Yimella sp. cx-573]